MRTVFVRAWAAAVVVLLAGCTAPTPGEDAPQAAWPLGIAPADAEPGFYLLPHGGGDLALSVTGSARLELYSPEDVRLGSLTLGDLMGREPVRLPRPAGDHVLHVLGVEGELAIASGGAPVLLHPLTLQVERVLLVEERGSLLTSVPYVGGPPATVSRNVTFSRAPVDLQAVVVGTYTDVHVQVEGAGLAYEAYSTGTSQPLFPQSRNELAGQFDPDAIRDGDLAARVAYSGLDGSVLLEAITYVRALPPTRLASAEVPRTDPVAFPYGFLPRDPVEFRVADAASTLFLDGGPDGALVALFGPADERLGAYRVPVASRVAVHLPGGGDYVAVLLEGNATMGADAAPAAFDVRPLATRSAYGPVAAAGGEGGYGVGEEPLEAQGVLFRVEPVWFDEGLFPLVCAGDSVLRLRQGNETVLAWVGDHTPMVGSGTASGLLDGSLLTIWHDGHGDGNCGRPGIAAHGYVR